MSAVPSWPGIGVGHLSHPTLFRPPFSDPAWLFEIKLDGFRALARKKGDEISLMSRNGKSLLAPFPEVAAALLELPVDGVFDGELIVVNEGGYPWWDELRRRSRMSRPGVIVQAASKHPLCSACSMC